MLCKNLRRRPPASPSRSLRDIALQYRLKNSAVIAMAAADVSVGCRTLMQTRQKGISFQTVEGNGFRRCLRSSSCRKAFSSACVSRLPSRICSCLKKTFGILFPINVYMSLRGNSGHLDNVKVAEIDMYDPVAVSLTVVGTYTFNMILKIVSIYNSRVLWSLGLFQVLKPSESSCE